MSLEFGMSLSPRVTHECSLRHELRHECLITLEQRHEVQNHLFTTRMELLEALRGERYTPKAQCPRCHRELTSLEIISGFNQDPNDFTTRCSGCSHRFEPIIICFGKGSSVELPFYCSNQCLSRLGEAQHLAPDALSRKEPAIFRSVIIHHGTLKAAFKKIGIDYAFEEILDWQSKIMPFLGRMPDTVIAECSGISAKRVGTIRRKQKIKRFFARSALSE